jgi:hypothetical protein
MADKMEAPAIARQLREETRNYCVAHSRYRFETAAALSEKCSLAPKCRDFVGSSGTQFVPFDYSTPTNSIVLTVQVGYDPAGVMSAGANRLQEASILASTGCRPHDFEDYRLELPDGKWPAFEFLLR